MRPAFCFFSLTNSPFIFFLIFSSSFYAITASDVINNSCQKFSEKDPNIDNNFCVASLEAAPDSDSADVYELGLITLELIRKNATSTRNFIRTLLQSKTQDSYGESCLNDCLELYSDALSNLKEGKDEYNQKRYQDANIHVSAVMDASDTCENGFKEKEGEVSPLTKRNNNTFQLSAIALSIINTHP